MLKVLFSKKSQEQKEGSKMTWNVTGSNMPHICCTSTSTNMPGVPDVNLNGETFSRKLQYLILPLTSMQNLNFR